MKKTLRSNRNKGNMLPMNIQMFAAPSYPESNLQTTSTMALLEAKTIDFIYRFEKDMRDFINVLGVFNQQPVTEGYTIKTKVALDTVTLQDGDVPEGDIIPLSKVEFGEGDSFEMSSKFWRKSTTYQAIQKYGFDQAVDRTDRGIISEIQKSIRNDVFSYIDENAAATESVASGSLQGAVATAWGTLEALFEGANRTIVFANPLDVAKYIAGSDVTTQSAFGISYLEAFTNTTILVSNAVERGEILATVPENLTLFYIPANSEGGQAFNLRSDESGFVGVGRQQVNMNATIESIFTSGIRILPEIANGMVKIPIETTEVPAG